MEKKRVSGIIMAIIGFVFIIISVMNYIFGWKCGTPPAAIGIVFLAVGMMWIKKSKQMKDNHEK